MIINSHQNNTSNHSAKHPSLSGFDNLVINDKFEVEHEIKLSEGVRQDTGNSINSKKLNDDDYDFLSNVELSDEDVSIDKKKK